MFELIYILTMLVLLVYFCFSLVAGGIVTKEFLEENSKDYTKENLHSFLRSEDFSWENLSLKDLLTIVFCGLPTLFFRIFLFLNNLLEWKPFKNYKRKRGKKNV